MQVVFGLMLFWLPFVVVERYVYCLVDVFAFVPARWYICHGVVHAGAICLFSLYDSVPFLFSLPPFFGQFLYGRSCDVVTARSVFVCWQFIVVSAICSFSVLLLHKVIFLWKV